MKRRTSIATALLLALLAASAIWFASRSAPDAPADLERFSQLAELINDDLLGGGRQPLPLALPLKTFDEAHPFYARGRELAATTCSLCHLAPQVGSLPRAGWLDLFGMKYRNLSASGVLPSRKATEAAVFYREHVKGRKGLWDAPYPGFSLSFNDFAALAYYFVAAAETEAGLEAPPGEAPAAPFGVTRLSGAAWPTGGFVLSAVLPDGNIVLGSMTQPTLVVVDGAGHLLHAMRVPGVPTHITLGPDGQYYVTLIGVDMFPTLTAGHGAVLRVQYRDGRFSEFDYVLRGLNRPVRVHFDDLDRDGQSDMVVLEFGWFTGGLSWYRQGSEAGTWVFEKRILDGSGVLGIGSYDFAGDGYPDLVVLVAQAEETLNLLRNEGGEFHREVLDQKPPTYGFNSMVLTDVNADGRPDIVTTNGDNFDLASRPLKSLHGVRLYVNGGAAAFSERFFYPMHGAIQTLVADFDGDGRRDIAAISAFPDPDAPRSFVMLAQQPDLWFAPRGVPEVGSKSWVTMSLGRVKPLDVNAMVLTSLAGTDVEKEGEKERSWAVMLTPYGADNHSAGGGK